MRGNQAKENAMSKFTMSLAALGLLGLVNVSFAHDEDRDFGRGGDRGRDFGRGGSDFGRGGSDFGRGGVRPGFGSVGGIGHGHDHGVRLAVQVRDMHWDERSFHDHSDAHRFADSLRRRGTEVNVIHRGRMTIVRYAHAEWKTYRVVNDRDDARRLERWLESRGQAVRVVPA